MLLHTNEQLLILNLLSQPAVVVNQRTLSPQISVLAAVCAVAFACPDHAGCGLPAVAPPVAHRLSYPAGSRAPPRTNWTRLVPPSVLTGHVSHTLQGRAWPSPLNRSTPPGPRRCGTRACLATRAAARLASAWSGRTSTRPERSAASLDFFEMGMQPWPFPSVAEALHCRATGAWPLQGSWRRIARGSRVVRTAGCLTRSRESCVGSTSSERCVQQKHCLFVTIRGDQLQVESVVRF
jgi:hypothetical protein